MTKSAIEIIYQDNDILVINKPAGLSVTKDRSGAETVTDLLKRQRDVQTGAGFRLVHRLDKETSGLLILARSKDAQRRFCRYFEEKLVRKTYLALVSGRVSSAEGIIDAPIAPKKRNANLMCINRRGKQAVTCWQIIADFGRVRLLQVKPQTGRTHQIRVHLSSIGLNIIADSLYGTGRGLYLSEIKKDYRLGTGQVEKPLIDRLCLHAYQVEFPESPGLLVAGLDKHFKAAIKMLTKYNPKGPAAFIQQDDYEKILNSCKI